MVKASRPWSRILCVSVLPVFAAWPVYSREIADGLALSGDLRLRHEMSRSTGGFAGEEINHARMRVRVALDARVDDGCDLGLRFATGGKMTSTNVDIDALYQKADMYVDRAYARFHAGADQRFEVLAGRMPNPYLHTCMLWDSEYNPDGLAERFRFASDSRTFFVNAGQHVLGQRAADDDTYGPVFYALQSGLRLGSARMDLTLATAYYSFVHAEDVHDVPSGGDYALADLMMQLEAETPAGLPVSAWLDAFVNPEADVNRWAYGAGLRIGSAKEKGRASLCIELVSIEADALWINLADGSLIKHLETTDMLALVTTIAVGLDTGTTLYAKWYSRDDLHSDAHEDKIEINLMVRF